MKKLLLVMVLPVLAFAQEARNQNWLVSTNNGTIIAARSYSAGVTDTTEAFNITQHKTIYVNLMVLDSATILIDYALSVDGSSYTAFTLKDSLQHSTDGANGFKSVDLTSTALGAGFIKFRFRTSANAFPLGTTSATYTATVMRKRW